MRRNNPTNCPHCNVSLLGEPIPEKYADLYSGTHWKREIGIEYPERYDGIWYYKCPDCGGTFGGAEAIFNKLKSKGYI